MAIDNPLKIVLPSKIATVEKAANYAEKAAKNMNFSKNEIDNIAISLTEAVSNAIIHGNKNDKKKKVTVEIHQKTDHILLTVLDEGKGFDPKKLDDASLPKNLLEECGRGLYILKSLMDSVDYTFTGEGTKITLIKYLNKKNDCK